MKENFPVEQTTMGPIEHKKTEADQSKWTEGGDSEIQYEQIGGKRPSALGLFKMVQFDTFTTNGHIYNIHNNIFDPPPFKRVSNK